MTLELAALAAAAILLTGAILAGRPTLLLAAVLAYTVVLSWIILHAMSLLVPALGIAIGLGVLGLVVTLRDESATPDVTVRHKKFKVTTNNTA